jgi:hypothetical protein
MGKGKRERERERERLFVDCQQVSRFESRVEERVDQSWGFGARGSSKQRMKERENFKEFASRFPPPSPLSLFSLSL